MSTFVFYFWAIIGGIFRGIIGLALCVLLVSIIYSDIKKLFSEE